MDSTNYEELDPNDFMPVDWGDWPTDYANIRGE